MTRIIAHIDMDAFFAAVEERDRPNLRGKPIVVGADPRGGKGRGIVSTANYEARKFGIHSAMPISTAWRLAEEGKKKNGLETVFLAGNFAKYAKVSGEIMELLQKYSEHMEQASVDEAYLDLSWCDGFHEAERTARRIKSEIKEKKQLAASIGIGPNKLIAKIASDFKKPDGLTVVTPGNAEKFLEPLLVRKIPGVGPKTEEFLAKRGVRTVKDLKSFGEAELEFVFGKRGPELYGKIRGLDGSPLVEFWEAKSVGEQETFEEDTLDYGFLLGCLKTLCGEVIRRFKKEGFKEFRTVVITVRFADFTTKNRTHTLDIAVSDVKILEFEATKLFLPFLDSRENPRKEKIRLLGVRVEKLA